MQRDYTTYPYTQVRRKDRAVEDDQWIKAFLHQASIAYVSFSDESQPFLNSNIFVYDEATHRIYFHTAREGRTRSIIDKNPKVCLSVSEMGRLLPAEKALEFSVEYKGVSVFGKVSVLEGKEAIDALQLLLDKYFPHLTAGKDYRPPVPEEMKRTAVYAIGIAQWIGKQKQVEQDFPGAFLRE